jgi:hypothetical protein
VNITRYSPLKNGSEGVLRLRWGRCNSSAGSGAAHRPTECKILPLPELGQVAVFILGETVRVYAFAEPAGCFRLRSGKCVMTGMSRDEVTTFLLSVRATFDCDR